MLRLIFWFLYYCHVGVDALAVSRYRLQPRICLVEEKFKNIFSSATNYTYTTVECYSFWCCPSGCCRWYNDFLKIGFINLSFLSLCVVLKLLLEKHYKRDGATLKMSNNGEKY